MIVVRFKVQCQPGKSEALIAAFKEVIAVSRPLKGVISFDIGRDLGDPNSFVATEVFENKAALESQEALAEVQKTIELLGEVASGTPEATIFHVSSSEPWG
ncbi:putative quinol monooxygenase [Aminobacter sp. LjRoot7]|uniref:putative quinol monooxygenase n=1 Tax=Aminobacter sp. LjRoot7 TaxID=3342335 RepID=UPI003ED16BCB